VTQAQLSEGRQPAWLQQLAHNPVRLVHPPLEKKHGASLVCQSEGSRATKDTGADDDDIGLMVEVTPLARVGF
jgi:hypothetical protein